VTYDYIRRMLVDKQASSIIGDDEKRKATSDDERAQSFAIAKFTQECFDAGFDPVNQIRMFLVGAIWLADQCGVSREQMIEVLRVARAPDVETVIKPR